MTKITYRPGSISVDPKEAVDGAKETSDKIDALWINKMKNCKTYSCGECNACKAVDQLFAEYDVTLAEIAKHDGEVKDCGDPHAEGHLIGVDASYPAVARGTDPQSGPQSLPLTVAEVKQRRDDACSECGPVRYDYLFDVYEDVLTVIASGASHAQALAKAALGEK